MTDLRPDPSLALPDDIVAPPPIDRVEGGPTLAGVAAARSFLVEGGTVALTGLVRGEVGAVAIGGRVVLADVAVDIGAAVNVVAAPGLMRRERLGRFGSVVETLLAPSTLPLAAVQWAFPAARSVVEPIEVAFTLAPNATAVRYHTGPTGLSLVDEAYPDEVTSVVVHPHPATWTVSGTPAGGVRVRTRVERPDVFTVLVASGPPARVRTSLRAGAHLQAQERRVREEATQRGLRVSSGAAALDEGLAWAQARLAGSLSRVGADRIAPDRAFWSALGALAVGDAESAARALGHLEYGEGEEGGTSGRSTLPAGPLAPLVAARVTLALGDPGPSLRHAETLDPTRLEHLRTESDEATWDLWALTLEMLADALRLSASEAQIGCLREAASLPASADRGGRRLLVVGAPDPASGPANLLRLLLHRGSAAGADGHLPPPDRPFLRAWVALARGDVTRGYALWRSELASGLGGSSGPRGSWEGGDAATQGGAPITGTLLGAFAHGLLGYFPDAPSGRVELFPALPRHFKTFDVENLPLADSRFDIRYRRSGRRAIWTVTPTRGRVPADLVLAPTLPGTRVEAIRLDGASVDLDWRPRGSGVQIQVKMPLDQERVLEVETR